jgi:hypothetical protein
MSSGRDWRAWHRDYDDPTSSLSRRLADVRRLLGADLDARAAAGQSSLRLLSLCAGDGRDTIPVLAERPGLAVDAVLVELDPELAEAGRQAASEAGVALDVRTGDAGDVTTYRDRFHNDVLMLCGVFGNISDEDVETLVGATRLLVAPGGTVIWTRGSTIPENPRERPGDPAEWVRGLFVAAGFAEMAFVVPDGAPYRVGAHRQTDGASSGWVPQRLFTFRR